MRPQHRYRQQGYSDISLSLSFDPEPQYTNQFGVVVDIGELSEINEDFFVATRSFDSLGSDVAITSTVQGPLLFDHDTALTEGDIHLFEFTEFYDLFDGDAYTHHIREARLRSSSGVIFTQTITLNDRFEASRPVETIILRPSHAST